jgi:hypothetical protein
VPSVRPNQRRSCFGQHHRTAHREPRAASRGNARHAPHLRGRGTRQNRKPRTARSVLRTRARRHPPSVQRRATLVRNVLTTYSKPSWFGGLHRPSRPSHLLWALTTARSGPCSGGGCASPTPPRSDRAHRNRRRAPLDRTTSAPIRAVLARAHCFRTRHYVRRSVRLARRRHLRASVSEGA